jgi:hypothetical protein
MTAELIFTIATWGVLPGWLLLAVAPRWSWTDRLVHSALIPGVLGLLYAWLFAQGAFFGEGVPDGAGFGSLAAVMLFFTVPEAVVAGWVHYLVFDLFIGAWIVRDAGRRGIPHVFVLICLPFALLTGPIGLLLYLILRLALNRGGMRLDETRGLIRDTRP